MAVAVRADDRRSAGAGGNPLTLLLATPVVLILLLGWAQRWMCDDGFINVRVVNQILAGNGPVFNGGERVEAQTSPLWVSCMLLCKVCFFWVPVEWIAVLMGMVMTGAAAALTIVSARRLFSTTQLLPVGILAYVVLPPAAVHVTTGLETGLDILWIAGWYLLLLRVADQPTNRAVSAAAFVIGLGPIIRSDLVVMSALAGVALLLLARPPWRRLAAISAWALALPASYELFRMGYYGNLLPNPGYTKEATTANWSQGWEYLNDFSAPYSLWVPALLLVVSAIASWAQVPRARRLSFLTPPVAGLVYGMFVIRGGGDFMHARTLLPAAFALQLPIAAVPVHRTTFALLGMIALWAIVPFRAGGPPYNGIGPFGITNERGLYAAERGNPVMVEDYRSSGLVVFGSGVRKQAERGPPLVVAFLIGSGAAIQQLDPHGPPFARRGVYGVGAIGMTSIAAGDDIYIADELGLASPIGSRLELLRRTRPAHEKVLPAAWIFAMFGDPSAPPPEYVPADAISAAREALHCPAIARMLQRARAPLTLQQIGLNVVQSFTDFHTRIHPDPETELARCRG